MNGIAITIYGMTKSTTKRNVFGTSDQMLYVADRALLKSVVQKQVAIWRQSCINNGYQILSCRVVYLDLATGESGHLGDWSLSG